MSVPPQKEGECEINITTQQVVQIKAHMRSCWDIFLRSTTLWHHSFFLSLHFVISCFPFLFFPFSLLQLPRSRPKNARTCRLPLGPNLSRSLPWNWFPRRPLILEEAGSNYLHPYVHRWLQIYCLPSCATCDTWAGQQDSTITTS